MLCSFHRVCIVFVCFFSIATAHAQEARVVVVPLGGSDIDQCKVITACAGGQQTLRCPSGNEQITCAILPKRVFITSTKHAGNLGGLVGADAICQGLAQKGGMFREFKAWLSDTEASPSSRFAHSAGPYVDRLDNEIATSWADLVDRSNLPFVLAHDEMGNPVNSTREIWSNTTESGYFSDRSVNSTCNNWVAYGQSYQGRYGNIATATTPYWTNTGGQFCNTLSRLLCVEQ